MTKHSPSPCTGRKFAKERLAKHEKICKSVGNRSRKVFDPSKARVAGTEAEKFARHADQKFAKYEAAAKAKKSNWRAKSEAFRAAMRAGRDPTAPPPPSLEEQDYVQCDSCGRKFNQSAAARHIPKCRASTSIRNPLRRR